MNRATQRSGQEAPRLMSGSRGGQSDGRIVSREGSASNDSDAIQTRALDVIHHDDGPEKADSGLSPDERLDGPRVPSSDAGEPVPAFTLGRGLKGNPRAQRIPLGEDPLETVRHHLASHGGFEAWISEHVWSGNRRKKREWQSAAGVWVDLDFDGHAPLPAELGRAALEALKGVANLAHLTPHGVRVIFLFPEVLADREQFDSAARGAIELTEQALREAGLSGLETDVAATCDLARAFLAPNATARCKKKHAECAGGKRSAEVVVLRRELWDVHSLASHCPPAAPKPQNSKRRARAAVNAYSRIIHSGDECLAMLRAEGWEEEDDEIRFRCRIPGHPDAHPSAYFNVVKHTWFCFVCGEGGGWMDLVELHGMVAGPRVSRAITSTDKKSAWRRPEIVFKRHGDVTPLHVVRPDAEKCLAERFDGEIFQRGTDIVEVSRRKPASTPGDELQPRLKIVGVCQPVLREKLDASAKWIRVCGSGANERREEQLAPVSLVKALHEKHSWEQLPVIYGVIEAPTMRRDGSLIETPGFDTETGIYLEPRCEYPPVPEKPTESQARDAAELMLEPFREFEFAMEQDRASLLALLLTIAARPAIVGPVPHWAVSSPAFGSGKSLLVNAATTAMTGTFAEFFPPPVGRLSDAESEMRKRITALLTDPPRAAVLDNVPDGSLLESSVLANFITSPAWTDRVLGKSERVTLPNPVVTMSTGCNFLLKGDLARRSLSTRIDPGVENPEGRHFEIEDLIAYVRERHPQLLTAAFTVIRAYMAAGEPGHGKPPLGSFEGWDRRIRGAVVWVTGLLGKALDPLDTQDRLQLAAPERTGQLQLATAWYAKFSSEPVLAKQVAKAARLGSALLDALDGLGATRNGVADARLLGNRLKTLQDRITDGYAFRSAGTRQGTALWRVERVDFGGSGGSRGSLGVPPINDSSPEFSLRRTPREPREPREPRGAGFETPRASIRSDASDGSDGIPPAFSVRETPPPLSPAIDAGDSEGVERGREGLDPRNRGGSTEPPELAEMPSDASMPSDEIGQPYFSERETCPACGGAAYHKVRGGPRWICSTCHPPRPGDVVVELHRVEEDQA